MDAQYLKQTVGTPLIEALTSMAVEQPNDAVEYIGNYLLSYVERKEREQKLEESKAEAEAALKKAQEAEAKVKAEEEAANKIKNDVEAEKAKILKKMNATLTPEAVFPEALNFLQEQTGATGVYVGRKSNNAAGKPTVTWTWTSSGAAAMAGKQVVGGGGGGEDGEEEEGEEGSGGGAPPTFDLWVPLPAPPKPEGEAEEEEEGEPKEVPPRYPEYVHVENVVLDKRVDFLGGVPKLGAYCAVPMGFDSFLHDEGVQLAVEEPQPPAAEGGEEDGEEKGEEEGEEKVAEEKAAEPAGPPEPRWVKKTKPVEMVLGLHTMGQGRPFKPAQIAAAVGMAKELSRALLGAEDKLFQEDVELRKRQRAEAAQDAAALPGLKAAEAQALADFQAGLPADMPEYERAHVEQCFRWDQARRVRPRVLAYALAAAPPRPPVLLVLGAAALRAGVAPAQLLGADGRPDWRALRAALDGEAFGRLEKYDPKREGFVPDDALRARIQAQLAAADEAGAASDALEAEHLPVAALKAFLEESARVEESGLARQAALAEAAAAAAEAEAEGEGEG
eukprot:CAMPEP_0194587708 /NCGR_PEP_ID=MMETSP0292-20121207/19320_1 /TAXON_ID=39354 /ORGANISM="Heterosigma akashiwo, Strain CCMP2393" /LENGTH=560 /DNA_ID=CAMNT_0039444021 /DNA_START=25 /DNA_END=1707 /DNA_ORIENTATION=-